MSSGSRANVQDDEKSANLKKPDVTNLADKEKATSASTEKMEKRFMSLKLLEEAIKKLETSDPEASDQKATLVTLKDLQKDHLLIEEAYRQEWCQMKLRYLEKFRPLYHRRWAVLTGASEDMAAPEGDAVDGSAAAAASTKVPTTGTKSLPKFWLKAMKNHQALDEMIEDQDEPILVSELFVRRDDALSPMQEYLEDIRFQWIDPNEQTSFRLDFVFAQNPYFTNTILSKAYYLEPSEENDDESVLTKTVGTEIKWHSDKNATETVRVRKQRNKRTNQTRTVSDVMKVNSFFNFFKTHGTCLKSSSHHRAEVPTEDQLEELTEDDVSSLEMIMETEFELGAVLRDKIIPRAVGWYLGTEHDDFGSDNFDDYDEQAESTTSSEE